MLWYTFHTMSNQENRPGNALVASAMFLSLLWADANSEAVSSGVLGTPAEITNSLKGNTESKGDDFETFTISYYKNGGYISEIRSGGKGIMHQDLVEVIGNLEKKAKESLSGKEVWIIHNHPAKTILSVQERLGLDIKKVTKPNQLLNGPTALDCNNFVERKNFLWQNNKVNVVNVIKEPGGIWVCGSVYKKFSFEEEEAYAKARLGLILATQYKTSKELKLDILNFEKLSQDLLGAKIKFIPNGATQAELEKAKQEVQK